MYTMIRKLFFVAVLAGFTSNFCVRAADGSSQDALENVGTPVVLSQKIDKREESGRTWYKPWTWFRKAQVSSKVSEPQGSTPVKKINYWSNTKDVTKGLLPVALCVGSLFFMPDSIKKQIPKDYLDMLNDPKVMAPFWGLSWAHFAWRCAKVKNDILNARNVTTVLGKSVENGISGAFANEQTKTDIKEVLKTAVVELFKEQPMLIAGLLSKLNLIKIGGGSDEEMAGKIVDILCKDDSPLMKKLCEIDGESKRQLFLQVYLVKKTKENEPLRVRLKKWISRDPLEDSVLPICNRILSSNPFDNDIPKPKAPVELNNKE